MTQDQPQDNTGGHADQICLVCGKKQAPEQTVTITVSPGNTHETLCMPCAYPSAE